MRPAPAGSRREHAGVLILAVLVVLTGACDRLVEEGPQTLELNGDTIQLAAGTQLVEVTVEMKPDGTEVEPQRVQARPGDVVRFTAGDGRMHALSFSANALAPAARTFLESGGQLRGPPLVAAGTQWVVNLEGAPPGEYPFTCITHGAHGSLVVSAPGS